MRSMARRRDPAMLDMLEQATRRNSTDQFPPRSMHSESVGRRPDDRADNPHRCWPAAGYLAEAAVPPAVPQHLLASPACNRSITPMLFHRRT